MTEFCLNHIPVPCREREFLMIEDPYPWGTPYLVAALYPGTSTPIVTSYLDGLGCPACGSFEPNEHPDA